METGWTVEDVQALLNADPKDPATWPRKKERKYHDPTQPKWLEVAYTRRNGDWGDADLRNAIIAEALLRYADTPIAWVFSLLEPLKDFMPPGPLRRLVGVLDDAISDLITELVWAAGDVTAAVTKRLPDHWLQDTVEAAIREAAHEEAGEPA
jgi:hypothetical protein